MVSRKRKKHTNSIEQIGEVKGWNDNGFFVVELDIEIRKSDGVPYDELTEEEQDAIDDGKEEIDYRIEALKIDINELLNGC